MKNLNIETFTNPPYFIDTYITYDTAELAAKKGYPLDLSGYEWEPDEACIPTQSLLQAWLRVKHNLNIVPVRVANPFDNHQNHVIYLNGREMRIRVDKPWSFEGVVEAGYEQCLERGLQAALKMIKLPDV